jgi:3-carboxy-cis,cis-muconate cycloisomerase
LPGEELFEPLLTTDELRQATGDRAWLQAMLDAERALALAQAEVGLIPKDAAQAIAKACDAGSYDAQAIGRATRTGGNPAIPLVKALVEKTADAGREWVHWGATSQDIIDTAAMLLVKRGGAIVDSHLESLADGCADLAERHRNTVMPGRTLLQQALPITFGAKAAEWLMAVVDCRRHLASAVGRAAAQLGGAAGTLASMGDDGPAVLAAFASHLALEEPITPWHSARQRTAEIACALAIAAGTADKISRDVALLMQTEVAEAAEPAAGGSSTMPHKQNPVAAAAVGAAARRARALVPVFLDGLAAEHERGLGGWQAEWHALSELLAFAGGAAAATANTINGLHVDAAAMAANLDRTAGRLMAERITFALAPVTGRAAAADAVRAIALREGDFAAGLAADPIVGQLGEDRIRELLDPSTYLGSSSTWIDRALAAHRGTLR